MANEKFVDGAQLDADMTALADAIRAKGGTSAPLAWPNGFVSAVGAISGGGTLVGKAITENGTYAAADDNADGYSTVTVNVEGAGTLTTKTVTQNGSYAAEDDGADGYSEVTVNVPGSANILRYSSLYLMDSPDLICTLKGQRYTKCTSDPAFVAYLYYAFVYTMPVLVSESEDGVKYMSGDTLVSYGGTIQYNGKTYYISGENGYADYDYTSSGGFARKIPDHIGTLKDAAEAVLDAAFSTNRMTENGVYPVPAGYDGYGELQVAVTADMGTKEITENGHYYAANDGLDGYSDVTVYVSGGGSDNVLDPVSWEQGAISGNEGYTYEGCKVANSTRIRTKILIPIFNIYGNRYRMSWNTGYNVVLQAFDESGILVKDPVYIGQWLTSPYEFTATRTFIAVAVKKTNDSEITPAEIDDVGLSIVKVTE